MKDLFGGTFYKWLAITVLYIIALSALDYIFSVSTPITFFESGILSFVTLWCAQQDKMLRNGTHFWGE